jgi:hypothetical protein
MKYILTHYSFYNATDEEIIAHGKRFSGIRIAYGSNSYNKKVSRVNEMFSWIKEDFPYIKEDDVEIRELTREDSNWIANTIVLEFVISVNDFIRLRNANMIRRI